jgi:hypothetical protein
MNDEPEQTAEAQASELEREERRLERLRLITQLWAPKDYFDDDSDPKAAA